MTGPPHGAALSGSKLPVFLVRLTEPMDIPRWEQRFRATRVSLPEWAEDAPDRCLYVSNATGTFELYTWDRATDEHRQATSRPDGTRDGTLSRDGTELWWFDDAGGDEFGAWKKQPFEGGEAVAATPGVPDAYPAGLALGRTGTVVGCSGDDGSSVHLLSGGTTRLLYASEHDAAVADLSTDETLVLISHSEHGDSRHPAMRVLQPDGTCVAELWDGPGLGLDPIGFSPVGHEVLALHEQRGRPELLLWDPSDGGVRRLELDVPGDLSADWYPDGSALLVVSEAAGRSTLHRYDLASGGLTDLPTPSGTIGAATARPDGTVELSWSSAAEPAVVRELSGAVLLTGGDCPGSVTVSDVRVDGPGGSVHALVATPKGEGPWPTVFLVHGGPTHHDADAFAADRAAYVDLGCAVVNVNYRGSTGYGALWRDALEGRPGLTELEDVAVVREWAISAGLASACVIAGGSWGGYLTLLALGTQPHDWACGVAAVPVADYVAAYEDEMEPLKAFDRSLFGGSPDELPELYARCSPLTYIADVVVPVLVLAGANDPRCPIRQIDNWLSAAATLDKEVEVYRFDAGHGSLVVEERIRQMRAELTFVAGRLGLPGPA